MLEIRIHGLGGQGAVTLAHLLAQAALAAGRQAQALPSFGVERRGAPVKAVVRIDDDEIRVFSQSSSPDMLVLMDRNLLARALAEGAKEAAPVLVNAPEGTQPEAAGHPTCTVDAACIARGEGLVAGGAPFINIPLLGGAARMAGIPFGVVEGLLRARWQGEAGDANVQAAKLAYEAAGEVA